MLRQTTMHEVFEIRDTGKYGMGVFATQDIKKGETVLVFTEDKGVRNI